MTLGTLSVSAASVRTTFATAAVTFGPLTVAATSQDTVSGTAAIALGGVTVTATGTGSTPAVSFYLLLETGGRIILEDGSGDILLEGAPVPPPVTGGGGDDAYIIATQLELARRRKQQAVPARPRRRPARVPVTLTHKGSAAVTLGAVSITASGEGDDTDNVLTTLALAGIL